VKKPNLLNKSAQPDAAPAEEVAARVTNDTVSHHRDEILSKGRQFKYPFHRSKHRIAIISILLVAAALVLLGSFMGLELYRWQNTSDFSRSVTKILPFPVAKVNGSLTSYESYLFELDSSLHWQEKYGTTDLKSPDGKRQIDYLKRSALDKALTNTIAHTLAKKNKISVDGKDVDVVIARIKAGGGDLNQILGEQFDFTESELRRYIQDSLLRQKVARALDKEAPKRAQTILDQIKGGKSFAAAASESSEDLETKQLGGDIGVVEKDHANLPQEVATKLFELKPGETSDVISTSSDYYLITMTEKVDENRAKASIIKIKVKDMEQYLKEYRDQKKVKEYIKLNPVATVDQAQ
jgi:hypothetical protein